MTLEALLRDAAARGQLNHVSLICHTGKEGVSFRATYRNTKNDGHRNAENADPVAALTEAIKASAPRQKRAEPDLDFG